jgi:hypothetical protein
MVSLIRFKQIRIKTHATAILSIFFPHKTVAIGTAVFRFDGNHTKYILDS